MLNFTDLLMGKYDHIRPPPVGAGTVHRLEPRDDKRKAEYASKSVAYARVLETNRAAVLEAIRQGSETIADLTEATGLSKTTAQKHLNALMESGGVVRDEGERGMAGYRYTEAPGNV